MYESNHICLVLDSTMSVALIFFNQFYCNLKGENTIRTKQVIKICSFVKSLLLF